MATASSSDSLVAQAVREHNKAKGLAIILSNDYKAIGDLPTLHGTIKDNDNMRRTFEELKLAVISKHNVTYTELLALISSVTGFKRYPPSYKRLVFVFSGHGKDDYHLYTNDRSTVSTEYILQQFSEVRQHAKIPKMFFIDACRGEQPNPGMIVPRGGRDVGQIVPADGNWLVAYSTLPKQKAYEEKGKGGLWMSKLAERLRADDSSLNDILTIVSKEVTELYQVDTGYPHQQPEFISRLNSCIYFLREARSPAARARDPAAGGRAEGKTAPVVQLQRATSNPLPSPETPPTSERSPVQSLPARTGRPGGQSAPRGASATATHKDTYKDRIKWYCMVTKKGEPKFRSEKMKGVSRKYVGEAYIPKTCGWTSGDPKKTKGEAEEDAAAKLIARLKISS